MGWVEALVLGVVQGLTEFLPVSSTGHLVLVPAVLHWRDPGLAFDVWVHVGTLLAVLAYFKTEVPRLLRSWLHSLRQPTLVARNADARLAWLLILATIPGAVAGVLLHDSLEGAMSGAVAVSWQLIGTGAILLVGQALSGGQVALSGMKAGTAFAVGIGQAVGIIPGISRSGGTIAAALVCGMRREDAARFSFLLSIPIIAGSALFELVSVVRHPQAASPNAAWLVAFVAAAVTGYLAVGLAIRTVARGRLWVFAVYCFVVGGAGLIYFAR